ncbi:MAG: energy-coupling factor transporter ATPase [Clostridiales bacterium]|nr:energy-coupling factor transporter ATPase [Clostridiales bacterium]
MPDNTVAIKIENASYKYDGADRYALKDISLSVNRGEMLALLGRNGSGKSTLGKLLNGLFRATEGTVSVFGKTLENDDDAYETRKRCGMVFQDPDNQMVATIVEEDVAFGCENLGLPPEEIQSRVAEALKIVGMEQYANSAPHMLSGGQQQRIAIAGVVAMHPDIIVFDESTSMLDPSGREDIFELALRLNSQGVTVIWITHFMEEAARCRRLVIIDDGRIALEGTPREVFSDVKMVKSLGLEVPDMTYLAWELKKAGADISTDILTMDEMEAKLWGLMSKT